MNASWGSSELSDGDAAAIVPRSVSYVAKKMNTCASSASSVISFSANGMSVRDST